MRRSGFHLSFPQAVTRRLLVPGVALGMAVVLILMSGGLPRRFDPRVRQFEEGLQAKPEVLRGMCHVPTTLYATPLDVERCRLGADKDTPDGILIGDSFANHFTGMLDVLGKAQGWTLVDYTMDGCPPILGFRPSQSSGYVERCLKRNKASYDMLRQKRFSWVVLAGSWPPSADVGLLLGESLEVLQAAGVRVTIILANEGIDRADSCPIRKLMYSADKTCERPRRGEPAYFAELRRKYPNVEFVDPNRVICDETMCHPTIGDVLLYRDGSHLNDRGSRLIGQKLLELGVRL